MKLSVIIVNYNVKHFLEQCLLSVQQAMQGIEGEVWVADNNSVDGSCKMLRDKFPEVKLIENKKNLGFSAANNQCIALAKGEYVLLLNPDTVVEQDCFSKCIEFMDGHPDAGALGVKMIDGKGHYLPESKRGLPTPWVAFCKMSGLTRIFPHSSFFAAYYQGQLDKEAINEVEILAGAFMFIRKVTLEKTGLLDETFFMYGEDIDLSFRIRQSGFKNYYFPETSIIHYKGESTKRGSLNYVKLFYKAMLIFSQKHFSTGQTKIFSLLINLAIYLRAFLSVFIRLAALVFYPLIDALIIFAGFAWIIPFWESWQFEKGYYPPNLLYYLAPACIFVWLIAIKIAGGYRRPISAQKVLTGIGVGSLLVLAIYSLLDEGIRFSRAIILLGSAWTLITVPLYRLLLSFIPKYFFAFNGYRPLQLILVANPQEAYRISKLLKDSRTQFNILGYVVPQGTISEVSYLGNFAQIQEIVQLYKPDELVFSGKDIPAGEIIDCMLDLKDEKLNFKIAPDQSMAIIGSNSPYSAGDLYQISANPLASGWNLLRKRWFDLKMAGILLFFFPFLCWAFKNKLRLFRNCVSVFRGRKSWVGYAAKTGLDSHLPKLKTGIISTCSPRETALSEEEKLEKDRLYAKNYRLLTDLQLVFRNRKYLDQ